ncbi:MAG: tRNA (adenosine(37)-N6)-threonylcarbamoyltransferase complex ATPase subunit type 1 TsaE [Candidatus Paceibacterota bacterium]|jgi:tRNA threonylcarbamoyladenosine biosynthesis protein TsaE
MKKILKENNKEQIIKEIIKKALLGKKNNATIISLSGDLGAGKTTITKEIAKQLGIKENVVSPTFVIMKIYKLESNSKHYSNFKKLIHIDAYRIEDAKEFINFDWEEIISDKENLVVLEWPEKIKKIIPKNAINISLSHIDEETRQIEF